MGGDVLSDSNIPLVVEGWLTGLVLAVATCLAFSFFERVWCLWFGSCVEVEDYRATQDVYNPSLLLRLDKQVSQSAGWYPPSNASDWAVEGNVMLDAFAHTVSNTISIAKSAIHQITKEENEFIGDGQVAEPFDNQNFALEQLPSELLLYIFSFLRPTDLSVCAQVSKHWSKLVGDGWLWRDLYCGNQVNLSRFCKRLRQVSPFVRRLQLVQCADLQHIINLLGKGSRLEELLISPNKASESFFMDSSVSVSSFCHLKRLELTQCILTDAVLSKILLSAVAFGNLTSLSIAYCRAVVEQPPPIVGRWIVDAPAVRQNARESVIGPLTIAALKQLPLSELTLSACSMLNDALLSDIVLATPRLTYIDLSHCTRLTDVSIVALANTTPLLKTLTLLNLPLITDAAMEVLFSKTTHLESLNITSCSQLTNDTLRAITRLPRLHTLRCGRCNSLSGSILNTLAEKSGCAWRALTLNDLKFSSCPTSFPCGDLRYLEISRSASFHSDPQVDEQFLSILSEQATRLETLILTGGSSSADYAIKGALATAGSSLRTLNLSHSNFATDATLLAVASSCKNLTKLTLISCQLISNEGVSKIVQNCSMLHTLNVSNCRGITDGLLRDLCSARLLRYLDIYLCKQLTPAYIQTLRRINPRLTIQQ